MLRPREAVMADWARLYSWRCDPETMRRFKDPTPIALKDHLAWLERTLLAKDKMRLYVADDAERGLAVGTARLDLVRRGARGEFAEVSVTVEPRARGLNYGTQLVEWLVSEACDWPPGIEGYLAKIKPDNFASLRVFAAAGFIPVAFAEDLVTLELVL